MTLRELCEYNKIMTELDNMSPEKFTRVEKWSDEKRNKKINQFLNKKKKAITKRHLKKRSKTTKKNKRYLTLNNINLYI